MNSLIGKKIILVAPKFFGYDCIIEKALTDAGADVFRIIDRPFNVALLNAITKVLTGLVSTLLNNYYLTQIGRYQDSADYVLVINGQTLSRKTIQHMREKHPNAKFILYMWDSIENRPGVKGVINFYDESYSFDPESAKRYNLKFRPLFYGPVDKGKSIKSKHRYLMSFIGTVHSDRYAILRSLSRNFSVPECYWYLYLQARWLYWWKRLSDSAFRGSMIDDFYYDAISNSEVQQVFDSSEIIVDIEHPKQAGLTIRTFEVMRAGKKMITTNKKVAGYDFFDYGNICIIDRSCPLVPNEFIQRPFKPYSAAILHHYSVDGWLAEIFN